MSISGGGSMDILSVWNRSVPLQILSYPFSRPSSAVSIISQMLFDKEGGGEYRPSLGEGGIENACDQVGKQAKSGGVGSEVG